MNAYNPETIDSVASSSDMLTWHLYNSLFLLFPACAALLKYFEDIA